MKNFTQLKKNLKKDFDAFKKIRVAVLGDTATQFLVQAIRGYGYEESMDLEIFEAEFNQIERQILDPSSELYEFKPEVVILFQSSHKLLGKYNKKKDGHGTFAADQLEHLNNLLDNLGNQLNAKVICYNFPEIDDAVYGSYANQIGSSFLYQLRSLNIKLMELAEDRNNLFICDMSSIQNRIGKERLFQASIYVNTEMVLSIDALPEVAAKTVSIIGAFQGKMNKCLIIDLDNTMWGGVIGDDGIENIQIGGLGIGKAFTEFQYWFRKLKNRGIILAICSKNTESVALEPFEKHPDMVIRKDDIAVFVANWENKADNIRYIQEILNIGFDSMVFLDDNPFERNIVRENIPGITVPELPEDPAEYLEYLYGLNLFETISYSGADEKRTKQYQVEAQRNQVKKQYVNEEEFLKSLEMISVVEPFNKFNTPRVAQLSQRSNQFNLRTVRYTEADVERMSQSDDFHTFTFTLEDKFGDNGLICVIILKKENEESLFIDTWFMSCRVLKRGMENFVLNTLVEYAREKGFKYLQGEYIPTAKNEMVRDHYRNLGFKEQDGRWILETASYQNNTTFVQANMKIYG
ncbi:MAG: HAD-IIIC family phosphatase [Bacteroidetes bacterium]|nr:MAG: HAD-IIIC family phosphatase [Bacteroidota bacterium]